MKYFRVTIEGTILIEAENELFAECKAYQDYMKEEVNKQFTEAFRFKANKIEEIDKEEYKKANKELFGGG